MSEIFKIALSLSLSGALLIIVIAVCNRLLGKRLSKRWQYYIWLVVVLRLLIPFAPEAGVIGTVFRQAAYAPLATSYIYESAVRESEIRETALHEGLPFAAPPAALGAPPEQTSPASGLNPLPHILLAVWLSVALILFVRKITLYQSFAKYVRAGKTEASDPALLNLFGGICEQAGVKQPIELYINNLVSSPILMGFWRSSIVLPAMPESETEFRHICLHELAHYKRGDIFYKWLLQIALCLHWFNPLVHWMVREANRACELSCDEVVIRTLGKEERVQYGDTLLESLRTPGQYHEGIAALTLSESASRMKERLESMKTYDKATKGRAMIATALTFGIMLTGWAVLGAYLPGNFGLQSVAAAAALYDGDYDRESCDNPEYDKSEQCYFEDNEYGQGAPEEDAPKQDGPKQGDSEQDDSEQYYHGQGYHEQNDTEQDAPEQYHQPTFRFVEPVPGEPEPPIAVENPYIMPQHDRFPITQAFELNGFSPERQILVDVQIGISPGGETIVITDPAIMQTAWDILSRLEVRQPYIWSSINIETGEVSSGYVQPELSDQSVFVSFTFTEDFSWFWALSIEMFGPVYIMGHGPHTFVGSSSPQPFVDLYNQLTGR